MKTKMCIQDDGKMEWQVVLVCNFFIIVFLFSAVVVGSSLLHWKVSMRVLGRMTYVMVQGS